MEATGDGTCRKDATFSSIINHRTDPPVAVRQLCKVLPSRSGNKMTKIEELVDPSLHIKVAINNSQLVHKTLTFSSSFSMVEADSGVQYQKLCLQTNPQGSRKQSSLMLFCYCCCLPLTWGRRGQ